MIQVSSFTPIDWTSLRKLFIKPKCGQSVGATWTETAPERGMFDEEWRTAARRRLRLKTEESKMCQCGMLKDEKIGDHTRDNCAGWVPQ